MKRYKLKEGKKYTDEGGQIVAPGSIVSLTDAQVQAFGDMFDAVEHEEGHGEVEDSKLAQPGRQPNPPDPADDPRRNEGGIEHGDAEKGAGHTTTNAEEVAERNSERASHDHKKKK